MKAVLLKDDFQKCVEIAYRFVSTRPQIPILSNLLLSFEKGKVKISSTNLEIGITLWLGSDVKEEGIFTVTAKTLMEVLLNLEQGRLEISEKEGEVIISSSGSSINLPTTPPNDFPKVKDSLPTKHIVFSKKLFSQISQQVIFAASGDETKPVFSGVLFLPKEGGLEIVATDGVRLSRKKIETTKDSLEDRIIIPARAIGEIPKIFSDGQGDIYLAMEKTEGQVIFGQDKIVMTSRLIDGEFPNFEKIIPQNWMTKITLDREELGKMVQLASVFAQDYKIELHVSGGGLSILSQHPQFGSQRSTVSAKTQGGEIKIAFNWRFIKDFLNSVQGEEISISLTGSDSPGVFQDPKDESFLHLIMPIRTKEE